MIQTDTVQQNAEKTAIDIFNTGSPNKETALYIAEQLHQYGDRLTAEAEREQNLTSKIECNVGCCYCCYSTVYISPVEAILIGHFVSENYSLKKIDALIKRAMNNIRLTSGKTREERIVVWEKTPCIFLENEKCSIYSVRPFTCRAWHSLSADQCRKAFQTGDKDAEIDSTPYRPEILGAIRDGLDAACNQFNCETEPVDLSTAIRIILNHPSFAEAWINGERLFHP